MTCFDPPATALLYVSGNYQSGTASTVLSEPYVVRAVDINGAGIGGVTVTFSIISFPVGATGQVLSESSVETDLAGYASTVLTTGSIQGTYVVHAINTDLSGSPIVFQTLEYGIAIHWEDVEGEDGYLIQRASASSGPWDDLTTVGANVTAYVDTTADPVTDHFCYRVRSFNSIGYSDWSYVFCNLEDDPLNAPYDLNVIGAYSPTDTYALTLYWTNNSKINLGFVLERATSLDGTWTQITVADPTTGYVEYLDDGLDPATFYYYRVKNYKGLTPVYSAYSNLAQYHTANAPLIAPTGLVATVLSFDKIQLEWNPVDFGIPNGEEIGYVLYGQIDYNDGYGLHDLAYIDDVGRVNHYVHSGLKQNTYVAYKIFAYRGRDSSEMVPADESWNATTSEIECNPGGSSHEGTVYNVTAVNSDLQPQPTPGTLSVTVSWLWTGSNPAWVHEWEYAIWRTTVGGTGPDGEPSELIAIVGPDVFSYIDLTPLPNTTYLYQIQANKHGFSFFDSPGCKSGAVNSNEVTTHPRASQELPAPPVDLVTTGASFHTQVSISWTKVGAPTLFVIERKYKQLGDPDSGNTPERQNNAGSWWEGNWTAIATTHESITSFIDTNLIPGLYYYYRVRASNANGDSEPSNETIGYTQMMVPADLGTTVLNAINHAHTTHQSIELTWATSGQQLPPQYHIFRANGVSTNFADFYQITVDPLNEGTTSFVDSGLALGTTYSYCVVPQYHPPQYVFFPPVTQGPSNFKYDTTLSTYPAPAAPTGLLAIAETQYARLCWDTPLESEYPKVFNRRYHIYYRVSPTVSFSLLDSPGVFNQTQYTKDMADVLSAGTYVLYFKISSYGTYGGESGLSNEAGPITVVIP